MVCLGVLLLGSNFFGTLWASWTCMSISFARWGKCFFIIFSNKFSITCSSSSPSGIPVIQMLALLEMSRSCLKFLFFKNSCFFILFQLNVYFFLLLQIVDLSPSFLPFIVGLLVPCIFFFISLCIAFTSPFILQPYSIISVSILITSVLNSASDRLAISFLLSFFFLEFWSVLSFGTYFFVSSIWQPPCVFVY